MSNTQSLYAPSDRARDASPTTPRKKLPKGRSLEQVWNHFQVERRLAERLKATDRAGRRVVYDTMYDELFRLVPDHPRLTRAVNPAQTERYYRNKLKLIERFIHADAAIAEIAPGDCQFLSRVAPRVKLAYGVDISDQRPTSLASPPNLNVIVYDGYDTQEIPAHSLDLVFSDQLLEHLHPDDTADHFRFVKRLLKPGGIYVMRCPSALTGPHDVSAYFSDIALGFHLKEWTYTELEAVLHDTGFQQWDEYWARNKYHFALPHAYFRFWDAFLRQIPKRISRPIAQLFTPTIEIVARA